jgi:photosystem II stability/assembly factor-like uncharacterized protein
MKWTGHLLIIFSFFMHPAAAQRLEVLTENNKCSIRGLSVVNDQVIWVSGSNGTVGKSTDGGQRWTWMILPNLEKRDFRDIEAFDANNAVIIAVAEPALILRTSDGGRSWKAVFADSTKGMFLDAMHFANQMDGIVIGDPIREKPFIVTTRDGGHEWVRMDTNSIPSMADGEAFFAASGTNIKLSSTGNGKPYPLFVSGGKSSRLWIGTNPFKIEALPLNQGKESTGANSIDLLDDHSGIIVGGDFSQDSSATGNCILFDFSHSPIFHQPKISPHGYRSCVSYLNKKKLVACGTSGVDFSNDGGNTWQLISKESFHICQKAKKGNAVYLAGSHGRIARLIQ